MIYVIKCENDCYYVGRTEQGVNRVIQHLLEEGSEWTKLHKPLEVIEQSEGDGFIEDAIVKRYMSRHGIESVRGGSYSQIEIPILRRQQLIQELRGATDCCFHCGLVGHFIQDCPKRSKVCQHIDGSILICQRCGRTHPTSKCYATTHIDGTLLACQRCGRPHPTSKCYAKIHIDGTTLGCNDRKPGKCVTEIKSDSGCVCQ